MKYVKEEKVSNLSTIETFEADTPEQIVDLIKKVETTYKCGSRNSCSTK